MGASETWKKLLMQAHITTNQQISVTALFAFLLLWAKMALLLEFVARWLS